MIRLRTYVRVPYRARIPMTRAALMHRDRFRCAYCGAKADTVDHVVPRSRGGEHTWENCVAACADCNHRKADKLLAELGWTLRSMPLPPKGQHWRLLSTIKELDPAWERYLGRRRGLTVGRSSRALSAASADTVCDVSIALAHSLLGGVPLAVLLILVALIFTRKGPHPATYKMSDEWTHAADPVGGRRTSGSRPSAWSHLTVGGGASGKW